MNNYAPVARQETIRMFLTFAAEQDLMIEGADVSNAYLYGALDTPIVMEQPKYSSQIPERPGYACALLKAIYGLI